MTQINPKQNQITIEGFQAGIASSPDLGFADMRNLDVWAAPGYARLYPTTVPMVYPVSMGTITLIIESNIIDPNTGLPAAVYALDSNGAVWFKDNSTFTQISGNDLTNAHGEGGFAWKNYLFVIAADHVDAYGPLNGVASWHNNFISSGGSYNPIDVPMPSIVSQDTDVAYWGWKDSGERPWVAGLFEVAGQTFDPTNSATYSFVPQQLQIRTGNQITCFAELNTNLYIGTIGYEIYPWDKVSPLADIPIYSLEPYVRTMTRANNVIYFGAGFRGNIYQTNGSFVSLLKRFPVYFYEGANAGENSFQNQITINTLRVTRIFYNKGRIVFSLEAPNFSGIYAINIEESAYTAYTTNDYPMVCIAKPSIGYGTGVNTVLIPDFWMHGYDYYWYGLYDDVNSVPSADEVGTHFRSNYEGYFITQQIFVGNQRDLATYSQVEFNLTKALTFGQGVKIFWRNDLAASFTQMASGLYPTGFDYATLGGVNGFTASASIETTSFIQVMVQLTANPLVIISSPDVPELKNVILYQ
jgi:hypothetical protein